MSGSFLIFNRFQAKLRISFRIRDPEPTAKNIVCLGVQIKTGPNPSEKLGYAPSSFLVDPVPTKIPGSATPDSKLYADYIVFGLKKV